MRTHNFAWLPLLTILGGSCLQDETPAGTQPEPPPEPEPAVEPADSIEPLPVSSYVFYRFVRTAAGKEVVHVYSRDVISGNERLITTLQDDKKNLDSNAGDRLAISPDRRWIALSSDHDYLDQDLFLIGRTRMIWKVSADGKHMVRISGPLLDWRSACDPRDSLTNNGCPGDMFCDINSRKCTYDFWSERYEYPSFSADGQTIYAHLGITACDNVGCNKFANLHFPLIAFGNAVSFTNRPLSAGKRVAKPDVPACSIHQPTLSPDGKRLATLYSRCFGPGSEGVMISDPGGANPVPFPAPDCEHPEWRPDSQAVYCPEGNNLRLLSIPDNKRSGVLGFAKGVSIDRLTISRDSRWVVMHLIEADKSNLFLIDTMASPLGPGVELKPVGVSGNDFWPAF